MTPPVRIVAVITALALLGIGMAQLRGWRPGQPGTAREPIVSEGSSGAPSVETGAPTAGHSAGDAAARSAMLESVPHGSCGDGVQNDYEQCDDGNLDPFDGCVNCRVKPVVELTCDECIGKYPEIAKYGEEVCNTDGLCKEVRECVLRTGCFKLNFPAACYCGMDTLINGCAQDDFVPHGPCLREIVAAAGKDNPGKKAVLQRYFDPAYPLGEAMVMADELSRRCSRACAFERLN